MMDLAITPLWNHLSHAVKGARRWLIAATRPTALTTAGTLLDLTRSKRALVADNALLRHQLVVLARTAGRQGSPPGTGPPWSCWPGPTLRGETL